MMESFSNHPPLSLIEAAENLLTITGRIGKVGYDQRGSLEDYEIAKDQLADAIARAKRKKLRIYGDSKIQMDWELTNE